MTLPLSALWLDADAVGRMLIDSCYLGDVRDGLRAMIASGIRARTCVTSPPYWGLRDYGTSTWDGGDANCDHRKKLGGPSAKQMRSGGTQNFQYRDACAKCGARRVDRQLGLEPTIDEYIANMVDVFRLVRDVLTDDGTLWLNLGDSYAGGGRGGNPVDSSHQKQATNIDSWVPPSPLSGLKPKDLAGIPWRVAFALQADGWYLRQDIIWHKPNPMPEPTRDRCTKAHEYLFLLSKRERYYYDADAIAEPRVSKGDARSFRGGGKYIGGRSFTADPVGRETTGNGPALRATRNRRSVWSIAAERFQESHFATFPTALVEPCILAGSAPGDVVLDPFMGSGTVAQVAKALGRRWVGCELNPHYHAMIARRAAQQGLELPHTA